jgi:transposase-like protein
MHRTRQPLKTWFRAAYYVTTIKPGMSALQFQQQVGLTNYEVAFTMLHKLRSAMVRQGRDKLSGFVEVDETYIGGPKEGKPGRGAANKVIVVAAVDLRGKNANRVRLKVIPDVTGDTLIGFIKANVEIGSTIITDEWSGYSKLPQHGYRHLIAPKELIHIHRIFSLLKTWLLGTHHGAVRKQHLQAYLNEYTFRFNRRGTPMAAFQTVLGLVGARRGPTYSGLYGMTKGRTEWVHPTNPETELN